MAQQTPSSSITQTPRHNTQLNSSYKNLNSRLPLMASSLHASSVVLSSSSSCSKRIDAAIRISKPSNVRFQDSLKNESAVRNSTDGRLLINTGDAYTDVQLISTVIDETRRSDTCSLATDRMHLLLEAVADRVEMHRNIGEQRDNWNTLLLNSINMMTLTASTMAGIAAATSQGGVAVTASSALLFGAATGLLLIMNKIQPSQLAEEQRNATRLFKQLEREIQFKLAHRLLRQADVEEMTEKVLALDQAYPLPLLGKMLEKFPKTFEPAVWWPKSRKLGSKKRPSSKQLSGDRKEDERSNNGWSKDLEEEMRAIVDVLKSKDEEDYLRLGNIALKVNKVLAISGPLLTGVAAASSAFSGSSGALAAVAASAGALAAAVNTFEHGGQVGMVLEMYRNCAGFFSLLSESIESTLAEKDLEKRENGELFERKVAIKLGRSLSELRDLARKSVYSAIEGSEIDEFGSKLF